jgi:hypothetical protein
MQDPAPFVDICQIQKDEWMAQNKNHMNCNSRIL